MGRRGWPGVKKMLAFMQVSALHERWPEGLVQPTPGLASCPVTRCDNPSGLPSAKTDAFTQQVAFSCTSCILIHHCLLPVEGSRLPVPRRRLHRCPQVGHGWW